MNVFVYGTLKKGFSNNYILSDSRYIGKGSVRGYCLYHVAWYPAMIQSDNKKDIAYGEVYVVEDDSTIKELDELEDEGNLYKRIQVDVELENGDIVKSYTYVWLDKIGKDIQKVKDNNWIGNGGKRILVTGAVASSNEDSKLLYQTVIDLCGRYSSAIASPLDTMKFKGTNQARYRRAMELLTDSKLVIAEMSVTSTGQGMELQEAVRLNIPIVLVAKEGSKISRLILGTDKVIDVIYYKDIEDLEKKLSRCLKENVNFKD